MPGADHELMDLRHVGGLLRAGRVEMVAPGVSERPRDAPARCARPPRRCSRPRRRPRGRSGRGPRRSPRGAGRARRGPIRAPPGRPGQRAARVDHVVGGVEDAAVAERERVGGGGELVVRRPGDHAALELGDRPGGESTPPVAQGAKTSHSAANSSPRRDQDRTRSSASARARSSTTSLTSTFAPASTRCPTSSLPTPSRALDHAARAQRARVSRTRRRHRATRSGVERPRPRCRARCRPSRRARGCGRRRRGSGVRRPGSMSASDVSCRARSSTRRAATPGCRRNAR